MSVLLGSRSHLARQQQALLFVGCHWACLWWLGWTQEHKEHREDAQFILIRAIGALCPAVDDPYIQELPKSRGYIVCKRDLAGDRSVLILEPCRRWGFPLVGEEEDDGSRGGALGTLLGVALLSVQSSSCLVRTGLICLELFFPL
jgi:hypothetical protein